MVLLTSFSYVLLRLRLLSAFARTAPKRTWRMYRGIRDRQPEADPTLAVLAG